MEKNKKNHTEATGKNAKTYLCFLQKLRARKYNNFGSFINQMEKLWDFASIHLFFDSDLTEKTSVSVKFSDMISQEMSLVSIP